MTKGLRTVTLINITMESVEGMRCIAFYSQIITTISHVLILIVTVIANIAFIANVVIHL